MKRYSKILGQEIIIDDLAGTITAADGVVYDRIELAVIGGASDEMKKAVHKVKKIFEGKAVTCRQHMKKL